MRANGQWRKDRAWVAWGWREGGVGTRGRDCQGAGGNLRRWGICSLSWLWWWLRGYKHMSEWIKCIKLYTWNMYSLWSVNYTPLNLLNNSEMLHRSVVNSRRRSFRSWKWILWGSGSCRWGSRRPWFFTKPYKIRFTYLLKINYCFIILLIIFIIKFKIN